MNKFKISLILIISVLILFIGCAVQPQLTPEQKRELTTRVIESDYENTFRSILTVIQDRQFIIENTDMNTGLIKATIDVETDRTSQTIQAAFTGQVSNKGQKENLSFMVSKISDNKTEVRLNIQVAVYGQSSRYGSSNEQQSSQQVLEPEIYNRLFEEIRAEVERRKALNN